VLGIHLVCYFLFFFLLVDTYIPSRSPKFDAGSMMSALLECLSCVLTWLETTRVRESADILVSYLIFPDRVKLLLSWFGVGVIARLDIIVLRGEAQIIFRRSGRCSLLIARRDGRLDSIETGLKIHSETARINGPKCLTPRKLNFLPNFPTFLFHTFLYLLSLLPDKLFVYFGRRCFVESQFCGTRKDKREEKKRKLT